MTGFKHGYAGTPTYKSWLSMRRRCTEGGAYYGAGVTVCERWGSFENFLVDMGERPKDTTLDRFPNRSGNYEPCNCRWATHHEQQRNKDSLQFVEFRGERLCIGEWAERTGLSGALIANRLRRGLPPERALTDPVRVAKSHRRVLSDEDVRRIVREEIALALAEFAQKHYQAVNA